MNLVNPEPKVRKTKHTAHELRELRWKPASLDASYRAAAATETVVKLEALKLPLKERAAHINQNWYTTLCGNRNFFELVHNGSKRYAMSCGSHKWDRSYCFNVGSLITYRRHVA